MHMLLKYCGKSQDHLYTEPMDKSWKQKTKGQDTHQRERRREPKKYDYSSEPDAVDELLKIIKDKDSKIEKLEKRNEAVEKRSTEITKGMAKVTDTKGSFENTNDVHANTNLTERFSKLYDEDWVNLSKWLIKTHPTVSELEMIHYLTDLMRNGYRKCLQFSDEQIRQFLLLDESQGIPTFVNNPEIYAIRKTYVQTERARTKVKRAVLEKILPASEKSTFSEGDKSQEMERRLQDFLCKYLDCCWLMIVSVPPISLNFEVVGKNFCKEHYRKYSCKKPVQDKTKQEDTVCEVVWPSVCLQNGSAFYRKGDVVVVTKGIVKEDKLENAECSCLSTEVCDSRKPQLKASISKNTTRLDELTEKAATYKKEMSTGNKPYQSDV